MDFKKLDADRLRRVYNKFKTCEGLYVVDENGQRCPHITAIRDFLEYEFLPFVKEIVSQKFGKSIKVSLSFKFESGVLGAYEISTETIHIYAHSIFSDIFDSLGEGDGNVQDVDGSSIFWKFLKTILHECRHALQCLYSSSYGGEKYIPEKNQELFKAAVDYIKASPQKTIKKEREKKIFSKLLNLNEEEYKTLNYMLYFDRIIEIDARKSAYTEIKDGLDDLFEILNIDEEDKKFIRISLNAESYLDYESVKENRGKLNSQNITKSNIMSIFQRLEDIEKALEIIRSYRRDERYYSSFVPQGVLIDTTDYSYSKKPEISVRSQFAGLGLSIYRSALEERLEECDFDKLLEFLEYVSDKKVKTYIDGRLDIVPTDTNLGQGKRTLLSVIYKKIKYSSSRKEEYEQKLLEFLKNKPEFSINFIPERWTGSEVSESFKKSVFDLACETIDSGVKFDIKEILNLRISSEYMSELLLRIFKTDPASFDHSIAKDVRYILFNFDDHKPFLTDLVKAAQEKINDGNVSEEIKFKIRNFFFSFNQEYKNFIERTEKRVNEGELSLEEYFVEINVDGIFADIDSMINVPNFPQLKISKMIEDNSFEALTEKLIEGISLDEHIIFETLGFEDLEGYLLKIKSVQEFDIWDIHDLEDCLAKIKLVKLLARRKSKEQGKTEQKYLKEIGFDSKLIYEIEARLYEILAEKNPDKLCLYENERAIIGLLFEDYLTGCDCMPAMTVARIDKLNPEYIIKYISHIPEGYYFHVLLVIDEIKREASRRAEEQGKTQEEVLEEVGLLSYVREKEEAFYELGVQTIENYSDIYFSPWSRELSREDFLKSL